VSKVKTFVNSAVSAVLAALFFSAHADTLAWPFAIVAVIFGAIWLYLYLRDEGIKERAAQEAIAYKENPPAPQKESSGNRLIVQSPAKRRK
jgi:hypothetical protein